MNADITDEMAAHVETIQSGADQLQTKVYELQLEVVRLEAELARQPERRAFIDGADMLSVFSRLYTRAQEEHREATAQGQKGRAHQLENELDALARAMNWAMRVP
jgi:hypothetical protein